MHILKIAAITLAVVTALGASAVVGGTAQSDAWASAGGASRPHVTKTPRAPEKTKTPEPREMETESEPEDNQVASAIASHFGVSVDAVTGVHQQGLGYGEIARAYALAQMSGKSVSDLLAWRASGQGWGEIAKQLGVSVGQIEDTVGEILRAEKEKRDGTPTPPGNIGGHRKEGKGKGK